MTDTEISAVRSREAAISRAKIRDFIDTPSLIVGRKKPYGFQISNEMEKSEGFPPQLAQRANFTREAYFTCEKRIFHTSQDVFHSNMGLAQSAKPIFESRQTDHEYSMRNIPPMSIRQIALLLQKEV
jgi:hypothetical protein